MVYASAVITYTVYIECVNQSLADEFLQWLEHDHVRDVVQAGALRGEVCVLDHDPPRIACRYEFASREAFHAYEVGPAIELRKEGVERFGSRHGLVMRRELYTKTIQLHNTESYETIVAANSLAQSLMLKAVPGPNILWTRDNLGALSVACVNEARALLSKTVPAAVRTFGPDHEFTITILGHYATTFAIFHDGESQDELAKALAMTEDVSRRTRQILGVAHPMTKRVDSLLMILREKQDGGKYSPSSKAF